MQNFEYSGPWRPQPHTTFSLIQKQWLTKTGALTHSLRALGVFELKVLAEYPAGACRDEAHRLQCQVGSPVWTREIVMSINGIQCVAARSITPLNASHSVWQGMRKLQRRPLADILYGDVAIIRSNFEVARLNRQTALYRTVKRLKLEPFASSQEPRSILARRSVFWRKGTPLMVTECFLPSFWALV